MINTTGRLFVFACTQLFCQYYIAHWYNRKCTSSLKAFYFILHKCYMCVSVRHFGYGSTVSYS